MSDDPDAEQAVIGCILIDPGALAKVRDLLTPDDFWSGRNRAIFGAACKIQDAGTPVEPTTVWARLLDVGGANAVGQEYFEQLAAGSVIPTAASVRHYAMIVLDRSLRRSLADTGNALARAAKDYNLDRETVIAQVDEAVLRIRQRAPAQSTTAESAAGEMLAELEERSRRQGSHLGVLSGLRHLDAITLGWHRGELVILAARPSVGKSALICQWALEAAQAGKRTLVISLEMTRARIMERLIAAESGVDLVQIRKGLPSASPDAWERVTRAVGELSELPLFIEDAGGRTVSAIKGAAVRLGAQSKGLDLLAIDYLGLLRTANTKQSSYERVTEISGDLKALAKDLNVPVLCAAQLNRVSVRENRAPRLEDLRDSGAIEQDADAVLLIHRPHRDDGEGLSTATDLIVAKNRNGPPGTVRLTFASHLTKFTERAYEENAA